jgi:hypothetical protein
LIAFSAADAVHQHVRVRCAEGWKEQFMTASTDVSALADSPSSTFPPEVIAQADAAFTGAAMDIERFAHYFHRRARGHLHEELVAETTAFTWRGFLTLIAEGRDPVRMLPHVVDYAARHVKAGRRFAGKVPIQDALSPEAGRRDGYFVRSLPHHDKEVAAGEVRDALRSRVPGPAEEAICRADWADFLKTLSPIQRSVAEGLESGLNLTEIAEQRGVSKTAAADCRATIARKWDERAGAKSR